MRWQWHENSLFAILAGVGMMSTHGLIVLLKARHTTWEHWVVVLGGTAGIGLGLGILIALLASCYRSLRPRSRQ